MPLEPQILLVLRFWWFWYILIGVKCFNAIVSGFGAFEPLRLSFPLSLGASSRAFVAHGDVFWVRSFRP
jgi:hypothetical protein